MGGNTDKISSLLRGLLEVWSGRSVGKVFLLVTLAICLYQAWKKWRIKRLIHRRIRGKVVLITGASSGLGEALARVFFAEGGKLILAGRQTQQMEDLKFQLDNEPKKEGVRHSPKIMFLDLTDKDSLTDKAQEAIGHYGRVDVLINNAGISCRGSVMETLDSVNRRVMEVNFFGTVRWTKELLPTMLEQDGRGQIVVISSLQGKIGIPLRASYAASKHALQGYFDSLRCEVAPKGIQVTVVCPGYIKTSLSLNALNSEGSKHGVMDRRTERGMAPLRAAQAILMATAEGKRELVLASPLHQLAVYMRTLSPTLLDWAINKRSKE